MDAGRNHISSIEGDPFDPRPFLALNVSRTQTHWVCHRIWGDFLEGHTYLLFLAHLHG